MKKSILIIILMLFFGEMNAQKSKKFISKDPSFKTGDVVFLFGDKVRLKEKPTKESKEVDLLKIGSKVTILEKTSKKYPYNGKKWHWYKVKTKNKVGYVVGGLLSLDTKIIGNSMYLISIKKGTDGFKIVTRLLEKGKKYTENINTFGTKKHFTTEVYNNRGVEGIKNMLFINYHTEASGINEGGYYLFNENNSLIKAIELTSINSKVYKISEEIIFPNDDDGIIGRILFSREKGGITSHHKNGKITKTMIESCEFVWEGKELKLTSLLE